MKKIIFMFLVLMTLMFAGCYNQISCNEPYIFSGNQCCLDNNQNKICDNDEEKFSPEQHTLMEIQKTLSTVLGKDLLLEKNQTFDGTQFYTHFDPEFLPISSCMSGCAGSVYVKRLNMDKASVGYILNKDITKEEFYDYVVSKKSFFLNQTKEIRDSYQEEFNSTEGLNRFFQKVDYDDYPFKNFTLDKNEIYDNFSLLASISEDSAVEYVYASIDDYSVKYGSRKLWGFDDRRERMLEFAHAIVLYCRPDLIIVLYGDRYDWRIRLNKDIIDFDVSNQFETNRRELLPKAKALLDVCIHKYDYGDFLIE